MGKRILSLQGENTRPIVHGSFDETFKIFQRFSQLSIGFFSCFSSLLWNRLATVEGQENRDERHGIGQRPEGSVEVDPSAA